MDRFEPKKFERYFVYPNESVDKLTVNRIFQRMYEDIQKRIERNGITLNEATEMLYGTARFSNASAFSFSEDSVTPETSSDYFERIMTISLLNNYADALSDRVSSTSYASPSSYGKSTVGNNNYWIKTNYSDVDFTYLPNGVNIITGNLEIGFNDVIATFGGNKYVLSGDVLFPCVVSGYDTYVNIDDESVGNISDYVGYSEFDDKNDAFNLKKLDATKITVPFTEKYDVTLKNNICNWTTYSSYKQSYVELHFSSKIDVNSLYEGKYGKTEFCVYDKESPIDRRSIDTRSLLHPPVVFEQTPIVMIQSGYYGSESEIRPIFGRYEIGSSTKEVSSEFYSYNTVSESTLTENDENSELSPVNGFATVKKIENIYDDNGIVTNNIIHFDVVMKFTVGSAADPKMYYGMSTINSRSKVQFAIIGV